MDYGLSKIQFISEFSNSLYIPTQGVRRFSSSTVNVLRNLAIEDTVAQLKYLTKIKLDTNGFSLDVCLQDGKHAPHSTLMLI